MSETQVDVTKVKGAALKTPTVTAALPISVENPALAYDSAKDRFKIDIEAIAGEDQSARDWSLDLAKLQNLPTDPAKESGKLTTIDSTLTAIDSVLDDVKALLAGGLPAALDGEALKVSEQNWPASYVVEATNLDIRDLTETERTPLGSKGVALQQKTTSNDLIVTLDGETITVQATHLDIRDLTTTERTPLGSNAAPLQQVAGDNALRVREQEFPSDYPDAATLAILVSLLAGGLPSTLTADKLKVRATEIETLLAAGLPSALDGDALKVSEQSPLSTIEVSNFPADYPDSAVATLLAAGLPTALDTDALKTREQNPITGFATQTTLALIAGYVDGLEALLGGGLPSALATDALKIREQGTPTVTVGTFPDNEPFNLNQVGGTAQTAADWTPLLQKLDAALSTMARLQPWYQTNFTRVNRGYSAALIAPHEFTNRWTYTIPASRIGRVMMAEVELMRDAAPVAAGTAYCYITIGAVFGPDMREITATVGVPRVLFTSEGSIAIADDVITCTTADGSNGGTYTYVNCANIMVFNT
jgi:hypothetical protein